MTAHGTPGPASLSAHVVIEHPGGFDLDVDFSVEPGETLALLGPNGAGKSTTIEALAGLRPLDGGRIMLGERVLDDPAADVFVPPEERAAGVVFQGYLLFDHLSVRDNVAFGPRAKGRSAGAAGEIADRWLDTLGLSEFAERRPPQLSGGQAQRVALARALAAEPEMLLLDEALAALDVTTRSGLRRVLSDHLQDFDGPRVLITHDPTDAFLLADRIAVLESGRLTQIGTTEDIRRRPATRYVAALAGTNLLTGTGHLGVLHLREFDHVFQAADTRADGPVLITIHPTAVALHRTQPSGSPRNTWETVVESVEPLGDTTRITLGAPVRLGVDITPASTEALELRAGKPVWASVKATEIGVTPAPD